MTHFAYSFCIMLLHSFWQAAFLLLAYWVIIKMLKDRVSPDQKKNLLFLVIMSQVVLSVITFIFYFAGPLQNPATFVNTIVNEYVPAQTLELISPWLFAAYIGFVLFKVARTSYTWRRFNHVYKTGLLKAPLELKLFTMLKTEQFAIKRPVKLFLSSTIRTPMTFGFLKPIILLPVALINQLSMAQAETLIIHELTHIKANDYLKNWIVLFAENVFFFNPFIFATCRMLRMEREKFCDTTVIHFQYPAALYAQTLLQAERLKQAIPMLQMAAVSGREQLLSRIRFFAETQQQQPVKKVRMVIPVLFLSALLLLCGYSALRFSGRAEQPVIVSAAKPDPFISSSDKDFVSSLPSTINTALKDVQPALQKAKEYAAMLPKKINLKKLIDDAANEIDLPAVKQNIQEVLTPVSYSEKIPSRQVIVQEEASGVSTLKVYTLVLVNGKWILQPGWMATSKLVPADSLINIIIDNVDAN